MSGKRNLSLAVAASALGLIFAAPAMASIQVDDASATEGSGRIDFDITLTCEDTSPCTYEAFTQDITATEGADYNGSEGQWVEIATLNPGESAPGILGVALIDDAADEPNETFELALRDVARGENESGVGTILDDDQGTPPPPPPSTCQTGLLSKPVGNLAKRLGALRTPVDNVNCRVIAKLGL